MVNFQLTISFHDNSPRRKHRESTREHDDATHYAAYPIAKRWMGRRIAAYCQGGKNKKNTTFTNLYCTAYFAEDGEGEGEGYV